MFPIKLPDDRAANFELTFIGEFDLISAAPDMYEALKEFENQLPELWGDGIRNGKVTLTLDADVIDGIMDAIRKAEGRTD